MRSGLESLPRLAMRLGVTDSQRLFHTVSGLEMLSGRILVSLLSFSLFAAVDTETGKILRFFFFAQFA